MSKAIETLCTLLERACPFRVKLRAHPIDRILNEQFECADSKCSPAVLSAIAGFFDRLYRPIAETYLVAGRVPPRQGPTTAPYV